jgi:threonine aldolase
MSSVIDLRSDTVTQPTPAMRQAMANAEVGDDVIDIDPTVQRLEQRTAELLGHEAALFMPSGSMSNQIALRVHCQPGDEFLCEAGCHIYNYEQGAFAQLSGLVAHALTGEYGILQLDQLRDCIRPDNEHMVRTRLITLENTHNRGAGKIQPYDTVVAICDWAKTHGLRTHLDGARLFNAVVASGISAATWAQHFDSVSVCFSKGLGAPVGSALVGSRTIVQAARRHRKLFGGGMRQAGIIAAGALYALDHHIDRLHEDHRLARILAEKIRNAPGISLTPAQIDTNMVIFHIDPRLGTAAEFNTELAKRGVQMLPFSRQQIRAVTHLDVNEAQIETAGEIIQQVAKQSFR